MEITPPSPESAIVEFERRKGDHIRLALSSENEALGGALFDRVQLIHEALPDLNFSEIDLSSESLGRRTSVPLMVSAMTAGHVQGQGLNLRLAQASAKRGWWMGVGSQRRQLFDPQAQREWGEIRSKVPSVNLVGNLGLAQAIESPVEEIQKLVESLGAIAMAVHLNGLQECLQSEGTPSFKGGFEKLLALARELTVPLILKETGCGFSESTLKRLVGRGVAAVDVSGYGGTHWGRIEGARALPGDVRQEASVAFSDWGISTVESLLAASAAQVDYEVWASGGVRTGVDAAKAIALGARMVGFAKPALTEALKGEKALLQWMECKEFELKVAMFCTGAARINDLRGRKVWQWRKT